MMRQGALHSSILENVYQGEGSRGSRAPEQFVISTALTDIKRLRAGDSHIITGYTYVLPDGA